MRPVNLIPKDQRRGDRAAMRTGIASYVLLGALAMGVLAVAVLALTSKVLNEEPPRVSTVAAQPIPLELDLLVQACVEKKREDRPQRITDLLEALDELVQAHPWTQEDARRCWERPVSAA